MTEQIGDRRTCEFQEIETYPADEFVYCKSAEGCKFQCLARVGSKIFCNKPVISHDDAIGQAARHDEREKVLDNLHKWFNNYCEGNEEPDLWMAFLKAEQAVRHGGVGVSRNEKI